MHSAPIELRILKPQTEQKSESKFERCLQHFNIESGPHPKTPHALPSGRFLTEYGTKIDIHDAVACTSSTLNLAGLCLALMVTPQENIIYLYSFIVAGIRKREIICLDIDTKESCPPVTLEDCTTVYENPILRDENSFVLPNRTTNRLALFTIKPLKKQGEIPCIEHLTVDSARRFLRAPNGRFLSVRNHNNFNSLPESIKESLQHVKINLFETKDQKQLVKVAHVKTKKTYFSDAIFVSDSVLFTTHYHNNDTYLRMWKIENSAIKKGYTLKFDNKYLYEMALFPDNQTLIIHGRVDFCTFNIENKQIKHYTFDQDIENVVITPNGLLGLMTIQGLITIPFEFFLEKDYLDKVQHHLKQHLGTGRAVGPVEVVLSYFASNPSAFFAMKSIEKIPPVLNMRKNAIVESDENSDAEPTSAIEPPTAQLRA